MRSFAVLIAMLIDIYTFVIIARAVISWVQPNPYNPIVQALYRITEPVLHPIRKALSRNRSLGNIGIDFSPLVVIILLHLFKSVLMRMLW